VNKIFVVGVICIILSTIIVPAIGTYNAYNDLIPKTSNIIRISGGGNILYVGGSGPNNYTKIQDAIDAASDGDTIFVYDDSSPYLEDFVIYKSVTLMGENRNTTILDGVMLVNSNSTVVENVTSTHQMQFLECQKCTVKYCNFRDGGIFFCASQSDIHDCFFLRGSIGLQGIDNHIHHNIFMECGDGIGCDWAGLNVIENNTFYSNVIGIYVHGGERNYGNIIRNNTFSNNDEGISLSEAGGHHIYNNSFLGGGISISGKVYAASGENFIHNNTIDGKPIICFYEQSNVVIDETIDTGQVILIGCSSITVTHQNIHDACVGIRIWDCTDCHIYENNISHCGWGIWLQDSSSNIIRHNNFINNDMHEAITCWKGIYHNNWNRNYWDNWRVPLPRLVAGIKNADWCPLLFLYKWWSP